MTQQIPSSVSVSLQVLVYFSQILVNLEFPHRPHGS